MMGHGDTKAVRGSVDDYAWEELAAIADAIASCRSQGEALQIAGRYHLCNMGAGTMLDGTQAKRFWLPDGREYVAQIAGFRHDRRSDGRGVAGITWVLRDAVAYRAFDTCRDVWDPHDWRHSSLRAYLGHDLLQLLPEDLLQVIRPVEKLTMGVGRDPVVSTTSDRLWALSFSEAFGSANWFGGPDWQLNRRYDREGRQYRLFRDQGVTDTPGAPANRVLGKRYRCSPCWWWLRTAYQDGDWWSVHVVLKSGTAGMYRKLADCGVVPGFCL